MDELKIGQRLKIRAYNKTGEKILWSCVQNIKDEKVYLRGVVKDGSLITFPKDRINVEIVALNGTGKYVWDKVVLDVIKSGNARGYCVDGTKKSKTIETKRRPNQIFFCTECEVKYKGKDDAETTHPGITKFLSRSKLELETDGVGEVDDLCTVTIHMGDTQSIVIDGKMLKKADGDEGKGTLFKYECALMRPCQAYFSLIDTL